MRTPTGPTPPAVGRPGEKQQLAHGTGGPGGGAAKGGGGGMKPRSLNTSFTKGYYQYHARDKGGSTIKVVSPSRPRKA